MKLSHFYVLIFLFASLISCKKTEPITEEEVVSIPSYVSLDKARKLLPSSLLTQNSTFIYKSAKGQELKLNYKFIDRTVSDYTLSNVKYQAETINGDIIDNDKTIGIHIDFEGETGDKGGEYFIGRIWYNWKLYPTLDPTEGLQFVYDLKSNKVIPSFKYGTSHTVFKNSVSLLGKEFKNVYQRGSITHPHYEDFTFNFEVGLVAFRDKSGELFVFERNE